MADQKRTCRYQDRQSEPGFGRSPAGNGESDSKIERIESPNPEPIDSQNQTCKKTTTKVSALKSNAEAHRRGCGDTRKH
jgi:hypothetical protein